MEDNTPVLDTPSEIEAFRLVAIRQGLELEIKFMDKYGVPPTASPTRGMALRAARTALRQHNVPGTAWGTQASGPVPRTRKQALRGMDYLCTELGLVPKEGK